jgi:dihydrofolate synthase/folylpolyglutamate synthase
LNFADALAYLDAHINLEVRTGSYEGLSLDAMADIMRLWGDPQRACPVIHITGTNGKGSTARMITRLLMANGLRVGTYTSPHLERYNERIRLDDAEIDDDAFAAIVEQLSLLEPLLTHRPSHFECLTACALALFAAEAVDVSVVEVGVMGRFDATNVVDADVAVITNVGRDHTDFVGDWRRAIAREKAGIIKPDSTLVLGETADDLRDLFEAERPARMLVAGEDFALAANRLAVGGRLLDLRTPYQSLTEVFLPLHGAHQGVNASLAVTAVSAFFDRALSADVVAEGLGNVEVPGRFEVVRRNPLVVLDGAHNPDGAEAAAAVLEEGFGVAGRRILVCGMLEGRDPTVMLQSLRAETFDQVITCTPTSPRALPADELALAAAALGITCRVASSIEQGVGWALAEAGPADLVFVTGSLYLVGSARAVLRGALHRK